MPLITQLFAGIDLKTIIMLAIIVAQLFMGKQIDIQSILDLLTKPSVNTQIKSAQLALDTAQQANDVEAEAAARTVLDRIRKRLKG